MPVIDWVIGQIYIPKTELTLVSGTLYNHDIGDLHLELRNLQDDLNEGRPWPRTHTHNTNVVISGDTYIRQVLILAPYYLEYEDGAYSVKQIGANTNAADIQAGFLFQNQVQVIPSNSLGGYVSGGGSGTWTAEEKTKSLIYSKKASDNAEQANKKLR